MKLKLYCSSLIGMFVLFACQPVSKTITIDNPSQEKITIVLDDNETIELAAQEAKRVMTKFGKRDISINGGETETIHLKADSDYLLNPTKSTYFVENIYYFFSQSARESHMRYNKDTIHIGNVALNGEFRRIENQLLIPKAWTFGPTEDPKQMVKMRKTSSNQDYHMTQKLHRYQALQARALQVILMEANKEAGE
ncbi:MAG: hypothetical protein AAF242_05765 [Bacteroidota bacterium]